MGKNKRSEEFKNIGIYFSKGRKKIYKYRKPKLQIFKRIGLTEEAYNKLRKEKRKQKKSMVKIICDLIKKYL